MAKVVLVWEMGADLGHVTRLDTLAQQLCQQGHTVTAIFSDATALQRISTSSTTHSYPILQGPSWPMRRQKLSRPPASLAEVLLSAGFYRSNVIAEKLLHWKALFSKIQADIILYDYAPTALLATRKFTGKRINLSDPFSMPPESFPLPSFDQNAKVSEQNLMISEQRLVVTTNQALREVGLDEITHAYELFKANKSFLLSIPELDPFSHLRNSGDYIGLLEAPNSAKRKLLWSSNHKAKKVFGYLKPSYPQLNSFLKVLKGAHIQGRFFIPNARQDTLDICRESTIEISDTPYDLSNLSECDLAICHAGHSTLLGTVLNGIPTLLIPLQQEQLSVTQKAVSSGFSLGLGHDIAEEHHIISALDRLLNNDNFRCKAQTCAEHYRKRFSKSTLQTIVEYVESHT